MTGPSGAPGRTRREPDETGTDLEAAAATITPFDCTRIVPGGACAALLQVFTHETT
jgi:hypothetical protein